MSKHEYCFKMENFSKFGPLLGSIYIGNTHCKFLIYAARNAEVLTCHEKNLVQITEKEGWIEFNPMDIWKAVVECIEFGTKNLLLLDINPNDIVALGITNQRETTILWNKDNGKPIYNAISWCDTRTTSTVTSILSRIRNKKNYLKSVCGLTLSTCFSAIKIKWLFENVEGIDEHLKNNTCLFGTLDTWILYNLTGGIEGGVHLTDVTNASRTMLMNLKTCKWDKKLCAFFKIPSSILPTIKSCSEVYGFVHDGPLRGIPITAVMGDQQAALLGQMCLDAGQIKCTFDEGCFLLFNTGQEIIESENGLLSTVAFQLGPKSRIFYALEGCVANAGSTIGWLKDTLKISTELNQNSSHSNFLSEGNISFSGNGNYIPLDLNITQMKNDVIFVPAFCGLLSPYWNHMARGTIMGLSSQTTTQHITVSAYEATCYQTRELLQSLALDCRHWPKIEKLFVGGDFTENSLFLQMLADLCGVIVERPQSSSPACLGVMLASGLAVKVLTLENSKILYAAPSDVFHPVLCANQRDIKYRKWKFAVKKCLDFSNHNNSDNDWLVQCELVQKDPFATIQNSIPGSLFIFTSFALCILADYLQYNSILQFF